MPLCSTPECVCLLCLPPSSSLWGSRQLKGSYRFAPPQSAFVFLGSRQLKRSYRFAPPQSASVFLGSRQLKESCSTPECVCLRLRVSSSTFVFVRLRFSLPTSSSISVFVCLCGSATVVCTLTVCAVFHAVRVKGLCCIVRSSHN